MIQKGGGDSTNPFSATTITTDSADIVDMTSIFFFIAFS
jgi:hypothetical protein